MWTLSRTADDELDLRLDLFIIQL